MELALRHALTYTTEGDVPVEIVARSLVANERLIHEALRVIELASPGATISAIRVRVASLSNASPLKQAFAVALFVAFQKDLEKEVPALIEKLTGHAVPEDYNTLVTVLVMMVAMAVIGAATDRIYPGKEIKKLKKEFEQKLEWVAQQSGLDKEEVRKKLDAVATKPGETPLLKKAVEFFLPAKLQRGAEILGGGGEFGRISAEAIDEIPDEISTAPDGSRASYELEGVVIDIHRADRDQGKYGWRAVIESVSKKKVRLELAQDIEAAVLYGKKTVVGDVTVIEELSDRGKLEPTTYVLTKVDESLS
jgi:hypothetical protein